MLTRPRRDRVRTRRGTDVVQGLHDDGILTIVDPSILAEFDRSVSRKRGRTNPLASTHGQPFVQHVTRTILIARHRAEYEQIEARVRFELGMPQKKSKDGTVMIWIENASENPIPCPRAGCPDIQPGETHRDTPTEHKITKAEDR